jgi:hypothetical protein
MSIPASMFAADLAAVASDIPQTVTFGAVTKRAVCGDATKGREPMDAGGFMPMADLEVHIWLSDWTTAPTIKDVVLHNGLSYRVTSIASDPSGVTRRLYCEAVTR